MDFYSIRRTEIWKKWLKKTNRWSDIEASLRYPKSPPRNEIMENTSGYGYSFF